VNNTAVNVNKSSRKWAKKELEELGFVVFRCSRSEPFDLIALKARDGKEEMECHLVECRSSEISESDLNKKCALANRAGCKLVVAYPDRWVRQAE